jgi:hypothetical protein
MLEVRFLDAAKDAFDELEERYREAIIDELQRIRSFPNGRT